MDRAVPTEQTEEKCFAVFASLSNSERHLTLLCVGGKKPEAARTEEASMTLNTATIVTGEIADKQLSPTKAVARIHRSGAFRAEVKSEQQSSRRD